jgi:hypothetical protein
MGKKFELPTYSVVVDTNAIRGANELLLIAPSFSKAWKECTKITTLHLRVPDIVRGERIYQLFGHGTVTLQQAHAAQETLKTVSGLPPTPLVSPQQVLAAIEKRFDNWIKSLQGELVPTPWKLVDWPQVISHALFRVAPFEPPTTNDKGEKIDSEKGFRDRLVLECLRHVVESRGEDEIAFITRDKRLREAIPLHFDENSVGVYDDMEGFQRGLLTAQTLNNNLLGQRIAQKAPIEFYDPTNPKCFYTSCRILETLRQIDESLDTYPWQAHRLYLMQFNVAQGNPPLLGYEDECATNHYEPHSQDRVWHNRTDLAEYKDGRTHWKTVFSQVRQFRNVRPDVFDLLAIMVRVSQWEVVWSCKIDNQSQFTDLKDESMMQSKNPYVEPLLDIHGMRTSEAWKNAM